MLCFVVTSSWSLFFSNEWQKLSESRRKGGGEELGGIEKGETVIIWGNNIFLIKGGPIDLPTGQYAWGYFLNWSSFFKNGSSLCRVDIKLARTLYATCKCYARYRGQTERKKNQTWWWLRVLVQSRSFFLNGFTSYPIPLKTSVPPTAQIRLHRILGMSLSSYVPVPTCIKYDTCLTGGLQRGILEERCCVCKSQWVP